MSHAAAAQGNDRRAFWLRKAHSLSGLVPVGAFMCFHLFENTSAAHGAALGGRRVPAPRAQ